MRHKVAGGQLNRTSEHRIALRRNLAQSLIEHETISTTLPKAKHVKSFVEKLVTLARKGDLASRRRAVALLNDRDILVEKDGVLEKKGTIIGKLFSEIGPRYIDRKGGYTRIIKLSNTRLGDNGRLVLMQFVGNETKASKEQQPAKKKKGEASKPKTDK